MHAKTFVFALTAAGCAVAENVVEPRDDGTGYSPHGPKSFASTVPPEKISTFKSDMHSLHSSIKANTMYSSMTAVMATAVPESFKDAMMTNPSSIHSQYKHTKPEWYQAIPTDVRSFMEDNRHKAKSIYTHDIGPMPTHSGKDGKSGASAAGATTTGKDGKGAAATTTAGHKSEADSVRIVGAAVGALLGAFGVAVLLL